MFAGSPWLTWAAVSELRAATSEERAGLGLPLTPGGLTPDMLLALVEITPWFIAPGWVDAWQADPRAEWTSLAAEAPLVGTSVAMLVKEMFDSEERGIITWEQEPQAALLAANLDDALRYLS